MWEIKDSETSWWTVATLGYTIGIEKERKKERKKEMWEMKKGEEKEERQK